MIRTFELSATPLPPADPNAKLPVAPTDLRDPGGRGFVAQWLGHVEAGRVGGSSCSPAGSARGCASHPRQGAGHPPVNEAARAIVLSNERLLLGRQRTVIE